MAAVTTGDNHPPRLPKVVITPETVPEKSGAMSLHVTHNTDDAAKLSPAATANCTRAAVLSWVCAPDHSNIAELTAPSHTTALRPHRLPHHAAARSARHPQTGTRTRLAMKGAEVHQLALAMETPRTRTR